MLLANLFQCFGDLNQEYNLNTLTKSGIYGTYPEGNKFPKNFPDNMHKRSVILIFNTGVHFSQFIVDVNNKLAIRFGYSNLESVNQWRIF